MHRDVAFKIKVKFVTINGLPGLFQILRIIQVEKNLNSAAAYNPRNKVNKDERRVSTSSHCPEMKPKCI